MNVPSLNLTHKISAPLPHLASRALGNAPAMIASLAIVLDQDQMPMTFRGTNARTLVKRSSVRKCFDEWRVGKSCFGENAHASATRVDVMKWDAPH